MDFLGRREPLRTVCAARVRWVGTVEPVPLKQAHRVCGAGRRVNQAAGQFRVDTSFRPKVLPRCREGSKFAIS